MLGALISVVVLMIGSTILSSTIKQISLSQIAVQSEKAFHAANAGMECARYWNVVNTWDDGDNGTSGYDEQPDEIVCGDITIGSGNFDDSVALAHNATEVTEFEINWADSGFNPGGSDLEADSFNTCTKVSVYKYKNTTGSSITMTVAPSGLKGGNDCDDGLECTVVLSKGYNRPCNELGSVKTVEREVLVRF